MLRYSRMLLMLVVASALTVSVANASPLQVRDSISRHNHAEQGFFVAKTTTTHVAAKPLRLFRWRQMK